MIRSVTFFLLLLGPCAFAQIRPQQPVKLPGTSIVNNLRSQKGGTVFSLVGGITQPQSGYAKDSAFIGKGWQLRGDVFIPLLKNAGVNTAVQYGRQSSSQSLAFVQQHYQLTNGDIVPQLSGANGLHYFSVTAGPQIQWSFGGLTLAPGINAGYVSLSRKGMLVRDSLSDGNAAGPGRKRNIDFFASDDIKAGGLTLIPRFKLGYAVTNSLSFWAGIEYIMGPQVTATSRFWQPSGDAKEGKYSFAQYAEGRAVTSTAENAYKALNMQAGISFTMRRKKTVATKSGLMPAVMENQVQPQREVDTTRQKLRASAPVILTPDQNMVASLHKGNLHFNYIPSDFPQSKMKLVIWKLKAGRRERVFEQQYAAGWNGIIPGSKLRIDSGATSAYEAQLTAFCQPGAIGSKASDKTQFVRGANPVYDNNGNSNMAAFNIQSNCTVDHSFVLDSTRCMNGDTIRIWGHVQIAPNSAGVTTGTITFDPAFLETTTNSSVTPLNMQPGNAFTVQTAAPVSFSFDVAGDMCNKQLRVFYDFSYQCPTLHVPAHIPCADTISLPCCICNYCDDPRNMNIVEGTSSTIAATGGLQVQQQFNVSPKNITKVTAQIVYLAETVTDEACRTCAADENAVYHFTGVNEAHWNGGGGIQATAMNQAHTYPAKTISWTTNHQGNLSLNMHVALPGLAPLSCCKRELRMCIRYSFTDKECRVCERLVCYEFTQQPQEAGHQ